MRYRVLATVTSKPNSAGYSTSCQLPTFYLDSEVQGITTPMHAADVARGVIDPLKLYERASIAVCSDEGDYYTTNI